MDDVSLSSAGRLFQPTSADTANALAPTTVLLRCADMVSTGYYAVIISVLSIILVLVLVLR